MGEQTKKDIQLVTICKQSRDCISSFIGYSNI